jgi:hypothetical protein
MASRKRPGSAKRTVAKQEAARKRSAPGKRFVGETAEQSARARNEERKKVARMARAARKAKPAEAARTAGHAKKAKRGGRTAGEPTAREAAAFRAAEEDAALRGAEVEPIEPALMASADDAAAETREQATVHVLPTPAERAVSGRTAAEQWFEPSVDISSERASAVGDASPPPLGSALADLARSALGLVRTILAVPFRVAFAIPRFAIRAVASV